MPSGYTHNVQTGKVTDFREFALDCAKAFGACITMRDEPTGTPIPDEFPIDTSYHDERLQRANERMTELLGLTDVQCTEKALLEYEGAVQSQQERAREREEQQLRYKLMLQKAEAWKPPTADHKELKSFMTKQLTESIAFDCNLSSYDTHPVQLTGAEWRDEEIKKADRDSNCHTDEREKEIMRGSTRNKWIKDLRESLGTPDHDDQVMQ